MKQNYMEKNPFEKSYFIFELNRILVDLVGLRIADKDYKVNARTFIPIYVEINYFCLLFYTLYHYRHDPVNALIATPHAGILIPVSVQ